MSLSRLNSRPRSTPACAPDELALFPPGTRLNEGRLRSGLQLRWYELGPSDRPAVLFVHGFPELAVSWSSQFAELAESYRLIAPDMRGYGGSGAPRAFWKYTLRTAAKDLIELLAHRGIERAHLVGHDMGAAIAWEAVQRFPAAFRSLSILNGPCFPLMLRHAHRQAGPSSYVWHMLVPFWYSAVARRAPAYVLGKAFHRDEEHRRLFTAELMDAYAKHLRRRGVPAVNYYRACVMLPTVRLRPVKLPVRLIWGEIDPWVHEFFRKPETYARFVDEIDVVLLRGKGHFVQQQAPAAVNAALREHWHRVDARTCVR